jgi:hypothetical protein
MSCRGRLPCVINGKIGMLMFTAGGIRLGGIPPARIPFHPRIPGPGRPWER